jgi:hypothetical protein
MQLYTLQERVNNGKIYVKILEKIHEGSETGFGSETITEYEHIWGSSSERLSRNHSLRGIRVKHERARVVK